MAASKQDIEYWFRNGISRGSTHMIIVCDTFDFYDYPVYVSASENAKEIMEKFNTKSMQQVMEVYDLSMNMDVQLAQHRVFNF